MQNYKFNTKLKIATIIILCYGCYGSFLNGDFVFDDTVAIVRNADVTNLSSPIANIFKHDFWGFNLNDNLSHKSYRPLTTISFRLQNEFLGLSSYYMKAINLLLHIIISCVLLFVYELLLSGDIDRNCNTSLIATALFAVHPVHTEAVSGIVGHAELLSALFFLIAFITYSSIIKARHRINGKTIFFYLIFIICTVLGLFSKENGITILPLCVIYDLVTTTNFIKILKLETQKFIINKTSVWRLCFLIVFTIILIIWRLSIMNYKSPIFKPMDNPVAANEKLITRILSQNYLYALNFWLLLCPDWLSFDWALNSIKLIDYLIDTRIMSIICFYMLCFGLIFKRNKTIYLGFAIIVITFLPASGIIKVGFVIAERILYLPSIGFCFLVAVGVQKLSLNYPAMKNIIYINLLLLIILWVLRTRNRSYEWTNEKLLFTSALRVCPNNAKIYYNIARLAADNNDRDTAFEFYHKAIRLYPDYESATMNLGNLYREIGDYSTASKYLKRSVEILEEFPAAWMNLGIIESLLGNYEESLNCYRKALKYRKNYATCYYNMGNLFIDMKNSTMALKCWRETITLNPKHQKAWANILALLDNKGLTSDVIRTSETALMHIPNDPAILFTRANAFGKLSDFIESERIFKQIIALRPNHALYHANLGVLYHRWGKTNLAIEHYENALTIDPNLNSAKENLKSLRNKLKKNHLN